MALTFSHHSGFGGSSSFSAAYRSLAESIWSDFENLKVDKAPYSALYKNHDVMKEYLQAGITYASFMIQERSDSDGPGDNFEIGSSPSLVYLEKEKYLKLFGCSFSVQCMTNAWIKNVAENSKLYPELLKFQSNEFNAMWDLVGAIADSDFTKWNSTYQNLGNSRNAVQKAMLNLWNFALAAVPGVPASFQVSGLMLGNYLDGTGNTFTESSLTSGQLSNLKTTINSWTTEAAGKTYESNGVTIPHVNDVTTPELLNIYGGDPTDKVVMVNFKYGDALAYGALHTAFGRATLVTDSNGDVKKVIDDYDWLMAWEVDRSIDGSAPGSPISDNIIVTGHGRRTGSGLRNPNTGELNPLIGGITAEDSYSADNPVEAWLIFTVSGAYGNGTYDSYADHPGNPDEKGKPFPVNIIFP